MFTVPQVVREDRRVSEPRGPRGPYSNGIARRQQIVEEAVTAFGRLGYNGASLRQIAERVGVSPAAINRHFASKEDLLAEVLLYWERQTAALHEPGDDGLAYWAGYRAVMEYHEEHRGLLALFLTVSAEATDEGYPGRDFIQKRYQRSVTELSYHLHVASVRGETAPMTDHQTLMEARDFIAFADGIELQFLLTPGFSLIEAFEAHWAGCLTRWRSPMAAHPVLGTGADIVG